MCARFTRSMLAGSAVSAVALVATAPHNASATVVEWDGGGADSYWSTAENWSPEQVPVIGGATGTNDDVLIDGSVLYSPALSGGDWANNSTVTIQNGGSWEQTAGPNWAVVGVNGTNHGVLNVLSGGSFDTSVTRLRIGYQSATGEVNVTGGNLETGYIYINNDSALNVSEGGSVTAFAPVEVRQGGALAVTGDTSTFTIDSADPNRELRIQTSVLDAVSVSGGVMDVVFLSFNAGDDSVVSNLLLSGGDLVLRNEKGLDYIYSDAGNDFVNIASADSAITLIGGSLANADDLISSGRVRAGGLTGAEYFNIEERSGDVVISLVPEPASIALFAAVSLLGMSRRRR